MFEPTSRYDHIETAKHTDDEGNETTYVRRRFLPQGAKMPLLVEVTVVEGNRLDLITARTLGDPEQFWHICDANDAMNPFDLAGGPEEEVGKSLRVPIPQVQG
jgi:hypothetical protein